MEKNKIIGLVIVSIFLVGILVFFLKFGKTTNEIPSYVTGEMREVYAWAKTPVGNELLEQVPCYCGCKYSGHKHARHCFWKDNGDFDKHGLSCSVCFNIGKTTKEMYEQGKDICDIRHAIDAFYEPNKHLATDTPMPEQCKQR